MKKTFEETKENHERIFGKIELHDAHLYTADLHDAKFIGHSWEIIDANFKYSEVKDE